MGTNPSIQIVHNHNNKLETVSIAELLQNRQHAQISQLWANFDIWGLLYCPLLPTRAKFGVEEQTHGLHLQATFRLDQFIFFAVWRRKTPNFTILLTSAFFGISSWRQSEKVEHRCTTTNHPLSNGIKIVSVFQCLHGEIMQNLTDKQKNSTFLANPVASKI